MGGAVFAAGPDPLYTPRMPRAVYAAVRARCHAVLRPLFVVVASPIDGPGKADFGDVDVLVAVEKNDNTPPLDAAIDRLGSVRASIAADGTSASVAIRWPADLLDAVPPPANGPEKPAHIQIDIALLPSLHACHWVLFRHGHGDLWPILGSAVLRPLGLTVDERALWLRVPEIEQAHRSRSKVFLTDEPGVVLAFLGLDNKYWDAPFASAADLFAYCTTCRFFALPDARSLTESLKANDRRRLHARPLFRQWATEFVPAQARQRQQLSMTVLPTRETVRDAAFAFFPGARQRFEAARAAWQRERHLVAIRAAAKAAVPATLPSRERGDVCAAVRRHLGIGGAGSAANTAAAEDAAAAWTEDSVTAYVQAEWAAIAQQAGLTVSLSLSNE